jgi:hypothetical protein
MSALTTVNPVADMTTGLTDAFQLTKGLSTLQRWVLTSALANREKENRNDQDRYGADLLISEIKHRYFQIPLVHPEHYTKASFRESESKYILSSEAAGRQVGHIFKKTSVASYNAISVSCSRCITRLGKRGLVRLMQGSAWAGVNLTEAGIQAASYLRRLDAKHGVAR